MLKKSYLHQNGVELNFLFIGLASRPAISLRINPRIREDSKGVAARELEALIGEKEVMAKKQVGHNVMAMTKL